MYICKNLKQKSRKYVARVNYQKEFCCCSYVFCYRAFDSECQDQENRSKIKIDVFNPAVQDKVCGNNLKEAVACEYVEPYAERNKRSCNHLEIVFLCEICEGTDYGTYCAEENQKQ